MSYTAYAGVTITANAAVNTSGSYYGNNTNFGTGNLGHFYTIQANIPSWTNTATILAAGGSSTSTRPYSGGSAIYNQSGYTVTSFNNYGYLLGGGGGGAWDTNGNGVGGYGGAGGGGGGGAWGANAGGAGGSLATSINGVNGSGTSNNGGGGGGGGPGGGLGGSRGGSGTAVGGVGGSYSNGLYQGGTQPSLVTDGAQSGGGYGGGNGLWGYGAPPGGGGGGGRGRTDVTAYATGSNDGGYSIYNLGAITNLYNLQGGNNVFGPLFYAGTLPTNYYVRINSQTNYGQLYCTGWYWSSVSTGSGMTIGIDPASTFNTVGTTTFPIAFSGFNFATPPSGTTSFSGYTYNWNLSLNGSNKYNLNVTIALTTPVYYTPSTALSTFVSSQFRHVVLSISGTIHTMYVDGVQVAQNANAPNLFSSYTTIGNTIIGATPNLSQAFRGNIGDLRVYNYAIQAPKVSSLYFNRNLIVHYLFDSSANNQTPNYGTLTYDATFKGNANTTSSSLVGSAALSLTNTAGVAAANYVLGNTVIPFNPSSGLTISCWINTTGVSNRIMRLFDIAKANGNPGISLDISGTNMLYSQYK